MGLELAFFYFILSSPSLTRDVTWVRLYLDGKNMRRQCQMNTLRTTLHWVFSCAMLSGVSWATLHRFFTNVVPRVLRQHWTGFYPLLCCLESQEQHYIRFFQCNVVTEVLRQYCTCFFPVQYCLEALEQHWTRFLPVQCCPKRNKTTLNRIFSCVMWSRASRTTLHRVFTSAMLPQEY